jgi:hypothetical protein
MKTYISIFAMFFALAAKVAAVSTPTLTNRSVSATTVNVNQPFTISTTIQIRNDSADHVGISVSLPGLTVPGGGSSYNSSQGTVQTQAVTTGGGPIYYGSGSRLTCNSGFCSAQHLLVESDWPSVASGSARTLNLTVIPKYAGTFHVRVRGWATKNGYSSVVRDPSSGTLDQQGLAIYDVAVNVVSAPTPHAPTLTPTNTSGPRVLVGQPYSITLNAQDLDGNLSYVDLNWNDGSAVVRNMVSGNTANTTFTKTFTSPQPVAWSATVYDQTSLKSVMSQGTILVAGVVTPTATPIITPSGGSFAVPPSVTISAGSGETVFYAINSTASTASTRYSGPFVMPASGTVQAIATSANHTQSSVASASFTIATPTATPVINPSGGSFALPPTITISAGSGDTVFYAINGTASTASMRYTGPFVMPASGTVQAIATSANHSQSSVANANFTIVSEITSPNQWPYNTDNFANPMNHWWALLVRKPIAGKRYEYTIYVMATDAYSIKNATVSVISDLRIGTVRESYSTQVSPLTIYPSRLFGSLGSWEFPHSQSVSNNYMFDLAGLANEILGVVIAIADIFDSFKPLWSAKLTTSAALTDRMLDENHYRVHAMAYTGTVSILGLPQLMNSVKFSMLVDENEGLVPEFFLRAESSQGGIFGLEIGSDRKGVITIR